MDNLGYVAAGYLLTAATLGGYVLRLHVRARRARQRAAALRSRGAEGSQ
jgi:hypothetical protein